MADPDSVAAEADRGLNFAGIIALVPGRAGIDGVIAPSKVDRFPVSPAVGRDPSGVAKTLDGAAGANVPVGAVSIGRPIRSASANVGEANGNACR
jgi:hypothetical protein